MFLLIVVLGFPGDSVVKNLPVSVGNKGSILGLERSHGERNSNPLQYSCLRNPIDRGAKQIVLHGVSEESDTT